jgi:hypothetical protein
MRPALGLGRVDHGALFIVHFVGLQNGNACHWISPCFYGSSIMTAIAAAAITARKSIARRLVQLYASNQYNT